MIVQGCQLHCPLIHLRTPYTGKELKLSSESEVSVGLFSLHALCAHLVILYSFSSEAALRAGSDAGA